METEFEAKFYPVNKEKYRKKLKALGAKLTISERRMVRIIGDSQVNPNLGLKDYIRVRDEGNLVRLSFKTMAHEGDKLSDQKEVDVEVSSLEKTRQILEMLGIKFNFWQENLREEWEYNGAQITIDTWPGLESYSEIEASSEQKVKVIAQKLGFDWDKKIITPIAQICSKVYGISLDEALKKIRFITFENNPFSGMLKKWNG